MNGVIGGSIMVAIAVLLNRLLWLSDDRHVDPEAGFFQRGRSLSHSRRLRQVYSMWFILAVGMTGIVWGTLQLLGVIGS